MSDARDLGRQRAWAALLQGLFLGAALAWMQLEKLIADLERLGASVSWGQLALSLAPEAGVALGLEALWLVVAWRGGSWGAWGDRVWRWGFLNSHLLIYAIALVDHQFFLVVGTRSSLELLAYGLVNFRALEDVLFQVVTPIFLLRAAAVPIWILLPTWLGERRARLAPPLWAAIPCALLAIGLPQAARSVGGTHRLATGPLVELLQGRPQRRAVDARLAQIQGDPGLYDPPRVSALARRPDVLLIFLESTRWDAVPPWRADPSRTPTLAGLAERAVVWERAHVAVAHTSKSLVSALCGMYPRLRMPVTESAPGGLPLACLPALLGGQGYRTLFAQPVLGGFEGFDALTANMGFRDGIFREDLVARYGERFETTGYFGLDERALTEPLMEWLAQDTDSNGPADPWFLAMITASTHHPFQIPGQPAPAGRDAEPAAYEDAVAYVDGFLGELLGQMEAAGHLDDALIVVVSDHGQAFGEHGRRYHDAVPWDEVSRVPLMVLGPPELVGEPRVEGGLRSHLDIVPTVLELVGAEWTGTLPGRGLLSTPGHERLVAACWFSDYCLSLYEGERKTIYHYGARPTEVFDLTADPGETRDLAPSMDPADLRAAEDRALFVQRSVDAWYEGSD